MAHPLSAPADTYLTAAECARETGVTVRALRLYEARGLIAPPRTEKNWRLYGAKEIVRLSEILALRATGLTLAQIADLLASQDADTSALLALQEDQLRAAHAQTERSLALIVRLREKLGRGDTLSVNELIELAKDTAMTEPRTMAWKRYEQMRPRTAITIEPALLEAYVGTYAFEDGMVAQISVEKDALRCRLVGQPYAALYPEADDAFFFTVVPAQITFTRHGGSVTKLTLHQNGHEFSAERCDPALFAEAEAARKADAQRVAPRAESEAALRRSLAEHAAGKPDYASMRAPLAEAVREQLPMGQAELERLGPVQSVAFHRATAEGFDVFDVHFANGRMECGISFALDGLIDGLYMRS
ncbi:MAG: MerR family transcriptional regulator [Devosiaceae bacterium]|nr:MerR family transcriptional regulator [Devosiaceae bacterium MH13]